jgi:Mannosyltransferase putative
VIADLLQNIRSTSQELPHGSRQAFNQSIEILQNIFFPWITTPKGGYPSFSSLLDSFQGEAGIVISTGKGGARWAIHQIVTLRQVLNSTLPIELFYAGDGDLPVQYRHFIQDIQSRFPDSGSITTIDITERFPDPDNILGLPQGGWATRAFAVLASSFKTVILTDADTVFLQDPRILLQEPSFREYGSVFWHDRLLAPAAAETYAWVDDLLESAKAKNLDRVRNSGWFRRQTYYEMERYAYLTLKANIVVQW